MTCFGLALLTASLLSNFALFLPGKWRKRAFLLAIGLFLAIPLSRFTWRKLFAPRTFHYEFIGAQGVMKFAPIIDDLVDERDLVEVGTRAYRKFREGKTDSLEDAFAARFKTLRTAAGAVFPSPFLTTALNLQTPDHFQLLRFDAVTPASPAKPAIFLHGLAGNFTLQCWLAAEILTREGFTTYCPSTRLMGDWWSDESQAILGRTIGLAGAAAPGKPILFVGLSNGAAGLMRDANARPEASGYILISGARPDLEIPLKPTLFLTGTNDDIFPIAVARGMKERASANFTLLEFASDHFLLARKHEEVTSAIHTWLLAHP